MSADRPGNDMRKIRNIGRASLQPPRLGCEKPRAAEGKTRSDPEYHDRELASVWSRAWRKLGFESIAQRYERMLKEQNGVCALCKRKSKRRLCVDHCHAMEMLRALLCRRCNLALGGFDDNPKLLREAAAYLDVWRAIHEAEAKAGRMSPPASPPRRSKSQSPSIPII